MDLGEINNHLLMYKKMLENDCKGPMEELAKTIFVIIVKGLFTPLRLPFAQFPCAGPSGDLLFGPFWVGVLQLERIGFI